MRALFYKGKKLIHVKDVDELIDKEGKVKSDLFNSEGALLVAEGKTPRDKIFKVAVYTYRDIYEEFKLLGNDKLKQTDDNKEKDSKTKKKEKLRKDVGENVVKLYDQMSGAINEVLDGKPISPKKIAASNEIINETINKDRMKLHTCISELRTKDNYTYNHCFSVYLLMAQALEDFRNYQDTDSFWRIFKNISAKVNFSKNGIQRYCLGALLHDYGKTLIPSKILNKPGKLTEEEFEIMKQHTVLGVRALTKAGIDDPQILEIVGNHHPAYLTYKERGQTPLALICNIVDVFDACGSKRVYKEPFPKEKILSILDRESKKYHWDSFVYDTIKRKTIRKFLNKNGN